MRGASWGSDLRSISDSPMRMRMLAGQSPNLRPLAMTIFSAKASVTAREPKVTAAGRRTTPAIGGRIHSRDQIVFAGPANGPAQQRIAFAVVRSGIEFEMIVHQQCGSGRKDVHGGDGDAADVHGG